MEQAAPMWVQFVPLLTVLAIVLYPVSRIIKRMGFSPWWSLVLLFVPVGFFVGLWVLAFKRWPAIDRNAGQVFE